ncbi:uncharacterized protein LOC124647831 isoform X2 [Lolium rigidum]|nr:uncharacterized protein LOC124647831 isoform X2 [Lolium rigidum]
MRGIPQHLPCRCRVHRCIPRARSPHGSENMSRYGRVPRFHGSEHVPPQLATTGQLKLTGSCITRYLSPEHASIGKLMEKLIGRVLLLHGAHHRPTTCGFVIHNISLLST